MSKITIYDTIREMAKMTKFSCPVEITSKPIEYGGIELEIISNKQKINGDPPIKRTYLKSQLHGAVEYLIGIVNGCDFAKNKS